MSAQERPIMSPHALACHIEEYINGNRSSRSVDHRWLAAVLDETLKICRQVRSDNLDDTYRKQVAAFRYEEIQQEKRQKQLAIDILEKEAAALKVEAA